MLLSHNRAWIERARYLATQARKPVLHYEHTEVGFNYRMSNLLAAVGRGQLLSLEQRVAQRQANNHFYRTHLAEVPGIGFMPLAPYGVPNCWLTCLTIDQDLFGAGPATVMARLEEVDIEARPIWKPMHLQPAYKIARVVGGAVAERIFATGLCLPSGSNLTVADRLRVVDAVLETRGC
jgi:pyridoxal phosphate-dependent aminotransferase EpsN